MQIIKQFITKYIYCNVPYLTIDLNWHFINILFGSQHKIQTKMQRVASTANIKIDFNLRQAKVGHSSIDKLPIRKTNSCKSISQISQASQNQERIALQSQQYSIEMLKRINQSLERQNAYLKKQLDFFTQACSSRRASLTGTTTINIKKKQDSGYKDRLMSRIDSKNDTQSTGMFNSKLSNSSKKMESLQENISDIYSKFNLKKMLPKSQTIKQITNNFLTSIKQNYLKLKIVVDEINLKNKQIEKVPKQTMDILSFLQMAVVYSKSPKMGKNALREKQLKQKERLKSKNNKIETKQQRIQQILEQLSSTNDLILLFESLIRVGLKNSKYISHCRTSIGFSRLLKKITKNQ